MAREGENPVPHYWAHVHWAFGAQNQEDFLEKSGAMNLNGHMEGIKQFRGIATRYDKDPANCLAAIKLICVRIWCVE